MTAIPMSHALLWWRLNPPETAFRCAYPQPAFRHSALTLAGWRELWCAPDCTRGNQLLDQWFGLRMARRGASWFRLAGIGARWRRLAGVGGAGVVTRARRTVLRAEDVETHRGRS